ncbi:ornithine carbamoyltransferase [Legionella israelensis]|uniref:ornithine carbamoyltransferase n=1 Tax=Legionella israelensis TaxID=454 RepID=UPI00117FA5CA|nr:ornithine carbamoyltransferase [Legionella israelensis]QDP72456.1 ornithine carbamoyltransferase [Legionella israelensis]
MGSEIKHLIKGDEFNQEEIHSLLTLAMAMKKNKNLHAKALAGQHIALIFEKPSLRTRFSFGAAANHLGAHVIESVSQTRKSESPKDMIRVIQGYCSAMMIRTFDNCVLEEMKSYAGIPIINGLTDLFHPCQSLADLMTLKEIYGSFKNLNIAYIGDGNNVLHSLMIMATKVGINVHYCCPKSHGPKKEVLALVENKHLLKEFTQPAAAVKNCQAVYTDVWTSMGFVTKDENIFKDFQVNETLMAYASENAVFMHCMPMERGKEVSVDLPDALCSVIFQQSENRMHVQKALLLTLLAHDRVNI